MSLLRPANGGLQTFVQAELWVNVHRGNNKLSLGKLWVYLLYKINLSFFVNEFPLSQSRQGPTWK